MKKNTVYAMIILLVALSLRLWVAFGCAELPRDDALEYDRLATGILSGKGYADEAGSPTSFRPPFYPFVLAAIYSIFGQSYLVVRIFQAILGTLTVLLVYFIAREVHSEKLGLVAAFFTAIYPSYVMLTKFLFTETLFTFLLALSLYLFLKMRRSMLAILAFLLGVTLGALSLTRSSAALLPLVFAGALILSVPKYDFKRAMYCSAVLMLSYIVILAPWVYRNTIVHKRFVLVSSNGGLNFYQSTSPVGGKIFGMVPSDENIEKSKKIDNEAKRDAYLFSRGVEKIKENPAAQIKLSLIRSLFYWGFFDWEIQSGKEYNYIYGFMLPFFVLGSFLALRKNKGLRILLAVILYFFLLVLVSQGTARYRLPTDTYLFILASYGMVSIFENSKRKFPTLAVISSYFLINFLIYLKSEYFKEVLKSLMERLGLW